MNRTGNDDRAQSGTGRETFGATGGERMRGIGKRGREESQKRKEQMDRLREVGRNLSSQVDEQVQRRPYVVIGAVAGLGFVAGSLFGSRLGQVLLAAGLGYFARNLAGGEFGVERIQAGIDKLTGEAGEG
jgi:hypothetical protein